MNPPTDAVQVLPGRVDGRLPAPPSKSVTHRAFLLAAQARDGCTVTTPLLSHDTMATLHGLEALGLRPSFEGSVVRFLPATLRPSRAAIDCGNSGTTLRLLAATAARLPFATTLTGDTSLRRRPNDALVDALHQAGATCRSDAGRAPLVVTGPLRPGPLRIDGAAGSQAVSAMLLATPFLQGPSRIAVTAPVASRPYLDLTIDVARQAGLAFRQDAAGLPTYDVPGGQEVRATNLKVPGDWSSAAFVLAAAAITGGTVTVHGLDAQSRQGDRRIVDHLRSFGAHVTTAADATTCHGGPLSSPGAMDVRETPDLFPVLAVLAACARGTTTLAGAAHLRGKESDRIEAMTLGLRAMGARATAQPDGLVVTGGALHGAVVDAAGDHRIHMAFAIAALAANGASWIGGAATAAVSFPAFHDALRALGARVAAGVEVPA
ncbi:MAG: 3-phosphoshikimate 1-carboxyvinyltransferase [bacterium]